MPRLRYALAIIALSALTGCGLAAHQKQLRIEAGAHTGCPAERVEIVGKIVNQMARVRICEAAHLCRWGSSYGGGDIYMMAATGRWSCEPVDGSTWVDEQPAAATAHR